MSLPPVKVISPPERAVRHLAKCWMCDYTDAGTSLFALTKDGDVRAFVEAQSLNRALDRCYAVTMPLGRFLGLGSLASTTKLPAYLVVVFADFPIYVNLDMIKRPLNLSNSPAGIQVNVPTAIFSNLVYEAKW